jgi:hypothetical protein
MTAEQILLNPYYLLIILVWTLPWKGVALWKAAKNSHKGWFIAILVINTLAIFEIIYIFYFSGRSRGIKPTPKE